MMSGVDYHIFYIQPHRLKVYNLLMLFSSQSDSSDFSVHEFIQSYSSKHSDFQEVWSILSHS